jgi:metal-responsive CopG/Arc/MetJ family transcriptional regulator
MSTEAKNIHLAEPLLAELEGAARSQQKTPDELADEAVRAFLRKRRWQELLTYGEQKGAESGIVEEDVPEMMHQWRGEKRKQSR